MKLEKSGDNKTLRESGLVTSGQAGVHVRLEKTVCRHLENTWSQPLHRPSVDVYRRLVDEGVLSSGQPFILDSGCGTGKSTQGIAGLYPGQLVVGVDRSQTRLARGGADSSLSQFGSCVLVRAELATFWRLLLKDGFSPVKHFLLYPNPWPKSGHLARRWHGHPVFPELLALGGEIELRSNWETYALEFALAVQTASGLKTSVEQIRPENGISPFEKKYLERGHPLFAVHVLAKVTAAFRLKRLAE